MVTIVVEDGSVVSGANSYISEAELTIYASNRGVTISGNTDELLIKAMDYIEGLEFIGYQSISTQVLQWPRYGVVIDYYYQESTNIPQELKDALAETALSLDGSVDPLASVERSTKREKIGELEVEYMDSSSNSVVITKINNKLRKLLRNGTSGINFTVSRA